MTPFFFLWAVCVLGVLLLHYAFVEAGWTVIDGQGSVDPALQPYQRPQVSFTPNVEARQYQTFLTYTGAECPGSECTGTLILNAPYYEYQIALRSVLCSRTNIAQPFVRQVTTTRVNTNPSGQPTKLNLTSQLGVNSQYRSFRAKAAAVGELVYSHLTPGAQRRALLGFNEAFDNCKHDPSYCQQRLDQAKQFGSEDFQVQGQVNNAARFNYGLVLEKRSQYASQNLVGNLSKAFQTANQLGQIGLQQGQSVTTALNAYGTTQDAISKSIKAENALLANIQHDQTQIFTSLGVAYLQLLAGVQAEIQMTADQIAFVSAQIAANQAELGIDTFYLASQLQATQVLTTAQNDLRAMVLTIINDPTAARALPSLQQQMDLNWQPQGMQWLTRNKGTPPIRFTDANKYMTLTNAPFFSLQPVTLVKTLQGNAIQPSSVVERAVFQLVCDQTFFATDSADKTLWKEAATWLGPDPDCASSPSSACICRFHVSYQQSRHLAVFEYYLNPANYSGFPGLLTPPPITAPLVPESVQIGSINANVARPTTFRDIDNSTLYLPPYRTKWLYTLADLKAELESVQNCLTPILSTTQLAPLSSPTFNTDPLGPEPANGTDPSSYYMVFQPPGSFGAILPMTTPLAQYSHQPTFDARPFCTATLTNAQQFATLHHPNHMQVLFDQLLRAYNANLRRWRSVLTWMNGVLGDNCDIDHQDFAWTQSDLVNDTTTQQTTLTCAACSVDGTPEYFLYNRTVYISAQFIPDSHSTQLPASINFTTEIDWDAPDTDSFAPDSFTFTGYVDCLTSPCPLHVLSMLNISTIETSSGINDTYFHPVPDAIMRHSKDPAALERTPRYVRLDYNKYDPPSIELFSAVFDGHKTRAPGPKISDWYQAYLTSVFKPAAVETGLHDYVQFVDSSVYHVPVSPSDGALPGSFTTTRCRQSILVSTNFAGCDMLDTHTLTFNMSTARARLYPRNFVVTSLTVPIPVGSTLALPTPDNHCPRQDDIDVHQPPLSDVELLITNSFEAGGLGPYNILYSVCPPQNTSGLPFLSQVTETLEEPNVVTPLYKTETRRFPACDGQTIQVTSRRISNPSLIDSCFSYTIVEDKVSLNTIHDTIVQFGFTTRDPVQQLGLHMTDLLQQSSKDMASAMQNVAVTSLFQGRGQAFLQSSLNQLAGLNATIAALILNGKNFLFGVQAQDQNIQDRLALIEKEQAAAAVLSAARGQVSAFIVQNAAAFSKALQFAASANTNLTDSDETLKRLDPQIAPIAYFFGSDLNVNFSDPAITSYTGLLKIAGNCYSLLVPPSRGPGSERPCNPSFWDVESWFNCIQGTEFAWRILIFLLMIWFVILGTMYILDRYKYLPASCATCLAIYCLAKMPVGYKSPFKKRNAGSKPTSSTTTPPGETSSLLNPLEIKGEGKTKPSERKMKKQTKVYDTEPKRKLFVVKTSI